MKTNALLAFTRPLHVERELARLRLAACAEVYDFRNAALSETVAACRPGRGLPLPLASGRHLIEARGGR